MGDMGPGMGDEGNSDDILAAYGNENDEEGAVANTYITYRDSRVFKKDKNFPRYKIIPA